MVEHEITVTCDNTGWKLQSGDEFVEVLRYQDGQRVEEKHYRADQLADIPFPEPQEGQQIQIQRARML